MKRFLSISLTLLMGMLSQQVFTQNTLTPADKLEISYNAKLMIKEMESLFNVISNENITLSQTEMLIENSFSPENPNQLFYNKDAIIEDDINPKHTTGTRGVDLSAIRYLQDLDIFYKKSASPTVSFDSIKNSEVEQKAYTYVRVYYKSTFSSRHKEVPNPYQGGQRIAELRADKEGTQWRTRIVSIVFKPLNEKFEEVNYQVSEPISLAMGNTLDSDSRAAEIEARAKEIEAEYLKKLKEEIQARKDRFEKEKRATYKSLVLRGDKAVEKEDYPKALKAYQEAQAVDPYQVSLLKKINSVKQVVDDKSRMETAQFLAAEKLARITAQVHDYESALKHYRQALKLRPGIEEIEQKIKEMDQKQIYLNDLRSRYGDDHQAGIKIYNKELKKQGTNPDLYLERGKCYLKVDKSKQAIADFTRAVKLHKDLREAYVIRGSVAESQSEYNKAITDFGLAISTYRNDPDLLQRRAKLYILTKKPQKAIEDYTEAIDFSPQRVDLYKERGLIRHQLKKHGDAVHDFAQVVRLSPKDPEGWYYRGLSYLGLGEYTAASEDFGLARFNGLNEAGRDHLKSIANDYFTAGKETYAQKNFIKSRENFTHATEVEPTFVEAWYHKGEATFKSKKFLEAIEDYSQVLKLDSRHFMAFQQRGMCRRALGQLTMAVNDFEATIRTKPDYLPAYTYAGDTYQALGKLDKALTSYDNLLSRDIEQPEVHFKAGRLRTQIGNYPQAVKNLSAAIKYQKEYPQAYYYRGRAYEGTKDLGRALADYNSAIKYDAGYPEAFLSRGDVYFKNDKFKKAIAEYSAALSLKEGYAEAHLGKARAQYRMGQHALAIQGFKYAFKLNPALETSENLWELAYTYMNSGQVNDARDYFEKALGNETTVHPEILIGKALADLNEGKREEGLENLKKVLKEGKYSSSYLKKHPGLKTFKKDKSVKGLISRYGR